MEMPVTSHRSGRKTFLLDPRVQVVKASDPILRARGYGYKAELKAGRAVLKEKVDAGLDFITTQMFFNNDVFYNFLYRAREAGIMIPVIAGIMPITSPRQLSRSAAMSGTDVPRRFRAIVDFFGDNPTAMKQAGIVYAAEQIIDLLANGIRHIHIYTMNKPDVAEGILRICPRG